MQQGKSKVFCVYFSRITMGSSEKKKMLNTGFYIRGILYTVKGVNKALAAGQEYSVLLTRVFFYNYNGLLEKEKNKQK